MHLSLDIAALASSADANSTNAMPLGLPSSEVTMWMESWVSGAVTLSVRRAAQFFGDAAVGGALTLVHDTALSLHTPKFFSRILLSSHALRSPRRQQRRAVAGRRLH